MNKIFCLVCLVAMSVSTAWGRTIAAGKITVNVSEPQIPALSVSLGDFGGRGDGHTLNSRALADAISYLESRGGGTLTVPSGVWLTGPIVLKSHIRLLLTGKAVIKFAADPKLYRPLKDVYANTAVTRSNRYEPLQAPLGAYGATDVEICGDGLIDGSGEQWRPFKRQNATKWEWQRKLKTEGVVNKAGDRFYPMTKAEQDYARKNMGGNGDEEEEWMRWKDRTRPALLHFIGCERVALRGTTFINSPGWNLHPELCNDIIIKDVTVKNDNNAANGDGIDLESCQRVWLSGSTFDVGDDGICLKSGLNEAGRKRGVATSDVVIDSCTVYHAHGGFVVGSEMSGGVRNVAVSRCRFIGTDNGLRFKSNRQRGGVVENIYVNDIYMDRIVNDAVLFDLYYGGTSGEDALDADPASFRKGEKPQPVGDGTPTFRNITVDGITCMSTGRAFYFDGLPERPIDGISLSHIYANELAPSLISCARGITISDFSLDGDRRLYLIRTQDVAMDKTEGVSVSRF